VSWLPLTATRTLRAQQVIAGVREAGLTDRACLIGLMMACAETGLTNPASYAVPASIAFDHDWVAPGDHLSVGIQQAQPWWGPLASRMTPDLAIQLFLHGQPGVPGLLDTPWETGDLGLAVQRVQRSAFSDGSNYRAFEAFATWVLGKLGDTPAAVAPVVVEEPAKVWHDGLPAISASALADLIHQPDGHEHGSVRLVFGAAARRGCGGRRSRMARAGQITSADHPFAVAVLRKAQAKRHGPVTGVPSVEDLHYLGGTRGWQFHATP
jgi:hypothetical protein